MNERDLETRLRDAFRVEAERADPGALSERVHSIPAMVEPERRRWWHRFRSGATRRAGLGGAQVRGANNMLSATRVAAVIAALALGTTFLAVQVGDSPEVAPGQAAPTADSWATVTGSRTPHRVEPRLCDDRAASEHERSASRGRRMHRLRGRRRTGWNSRHSGARSRSRTPTVTGRGNRSDSGTSRKHTTTWAGSRAMARTRAWSSSSS